MIRNKSLIIGLICGLLSMIFVGVYLIQVDEVTQKERSEALLRYGGEQVSVCVAKHDIVAGETIKESDIETKTWISALLPEGSINVTSEAVGKQVSSSILKGEVINQFRFGTLEQALDVPDGLSAISVPAQDVQAVGGALSPGMKTTVYAIGANSTAKLADQVLVLATSSQTESLINTNSALSWITLAVPPNSVEEIVTAAQNLELYFVLPPETSSQKTPA